MGDLSLSSPSSRAVLALLSEEGEALIVFRTGNFLILALILALKRKSLAQNEKQNENEVQKESLDKTAKALSFCGERRTEMEPMNAVNQEVLI